MARTATAIAAGLLLAQPAAAAQPLWGGSVSLASNHLLRGISRSANDPSLQAEAHVQGRQGWYAGLWAATSRARPTDRTSVDLAATLGFTGTLGEQWRWRGSYAHYESPWQRLPSWYRYNEFTLDLQLRDVLLLSASWSPDTTGYSPYLGPVLDRDALAYEISFLQPLAGGWSAHAGAGYFDLSEHFGEGYWYGSIGMGWSWHRWRSELSYVHPGAAARRLSWPDTARRRALLRVSYVFDSP